MLVLDLECSSEHPHGKVSGSAHLERGLERAGCDFAVVIYLARAHAFAGVCHRIRNRALAERRNLLSSC